MPKKLLQIAKELGVGLATAAEFLQTKGHNVPANPNHNITDEEQTLLIKEFKPDMEMKSSAEEISRQRHEKGKHATVAIEGYEDKKKEKAQEIKTEIPQNQIPKITPVGKLDLDKLNKPTAPAQKNVTTNAAPAQKAEVKAAEPEKPAAQPQKVVETPASVSDKLASADDEPAQVLTDAHADLKPNIKVLGKVDLDSLNQQTRPKKKSKEEKKRERDARFNHGGDNNQRNGGNNQQNGGNNNGGNGDERRQRQRINQKERIDVENFKPSNNNNNEKTSNGPRPGKHKNKHGKPMSDEDLMRSANENVRKTKAELFTKQVPNKNSAKYRHDKREQAAEQRRKQEEEENKEKGILRVTEFVTVSDIATMMDVPVVEVISKCMQLGQMVSINQRLNAETINLVADEFGFTTEYISAEVAEAIQEEEDKPEDLISRPPVVTVMGHVDHGKTSLLDYIRNTNVIAGEAGGITQHIGAYHVTLANGQQISFLDTPGHEAFTAMRARGAQVADVAIIIVAADDDVMPQTVEAINHASNAGIPIVFAINKVDKPAANPDKIREALSAMNYLVEDWGGKYQCQEISAKKGMGVDDLMEKVLLEAEMLDLKANPNRKASGVIIESQLEKGRGYTSTVLVNNGTLRVGDSVVAGKHYGKVKAMYNERNQKIDEVKPGQPALVLGLNGAPQAGDKLNVMDTDQEAREIATKREQLQREQATRTAKVLTLEEVGHRIALGEFHELKIIVKADVDGTVEALSDSLQKLSTDKIMVNIIHKAVGQISESDVMLASASDAIIVGFQVRPSQAARKMADTEKIDIRLYSIVYDAIEQIRDAMEGMLKPEVREEVTGNCEVQNVFKISKVGTIAGCMVTEGKIRRTSKVRIIREGIVIHTGVLESLKRFKDDAKEVVMGLECGLNVANYNDIQVGDVIEAFDEVEVARKLEKR
ncbi:MAG: translation initiation factor IF-2 [Paludibacteraceae bacterium]|nr:translation initiation factor IF-2 [Paludibacteraceae bacterium]